MSQPLEGLLPAMTVSFYSLRKKTMGNSEEIS